MHSSGESSDSSDRSSDSGGESSDSSGQSMVCFPWHLLLDLGFSLNSKLLASGSVSGALWCDPSFLSTPLTRPVNKPSLSFMFTKALALDESVQQGTFDPETQKNVFLTAGFGSSCVEIDTLKPKIS